MNGSPGQGILNYIRNPEEDTRKDGGSRDSVFDGSKRNALWGLNELRRLYDACRIRSKYSDK